MSICFIDGRWRPAGECCLPVTDLVIQRGVGVFDSIRIYDRRLFALDEHMKRLAQSAAMAGIECGTVVDRLRDIVREGAKRDDYPGNGDCIAKVYITGGDENNFGKFPKPRYFVILEECAAPSQEEYEKGVVVLPTPVGRPYPLMKSINYLFGMIEHAGRDDMEECLYCPEGEVTETLRSSFFMSRGGRLITAPEGRVLGGVTRNIIIQLARENGIEVEERCPGIEELKFADEAFLTGSGKEVLPVVKIGDTTIGGGRPGPMAARLRKLYRDALERWLDK